MVNDKSEESLGRCFFINSKVIHELQSEDTQVTILVNPLSPIGHTMYLKYGGTDISIPSNELSTQLEVLLNKFDGMEISLTDFVKGVRDVLKNMKGSGIEERVQDSRILKALHYLDQNFDRVVSLKEVAGLCALSETRFLHLFKEKTNLNFRRFQLWNRLIKSIPNLEKISITETAHMFGFTDSAHYSRTFTETFGFSPKFLIS